MERPTPTRRQFTTGVAAVSSLTVAGCLSDENDDDESDDESDGDLDNWEPTERYPVTMTFENGNGDAIGAGFEIVAEPSDSSKPDFSAQATGFENGTTTQKLSEGEYTFTVTSADDSFDDVEKDVTIDGQKEVTFVLEGAEPAE
ncbi:hypothetical protein C479_14553 [Halovivax asiaticus JCM 14624]|uniref:PEGA domain-containing protein n=2 Tax=Halovivax asiaticus TaxID=332953 RepID=M0BE52_9EURY|nr:hypothetical protein C479_14553 [Halovivax asiaticus JCM 14624]